MRRQKKSEFFFVPTVVVKIRITKENKHLLASNTSKVCLP